MNETLRLMHKHRSIRKYTDAPIPDADILAAVQAGQAASTSGAIQTYSALRITNPDTRAKLIGLTGGQPYVAGAGAFFVINGDTHLARLAMKKKNAQYNARLEGFLLSVIDATLFAQNMALALESMGYGVCFIGGLRNSLPQVDRLLNLPVGVYPLFGLCAGVPAQTPTARPRLNPRSILFEDTYPSDDQLLELLAPYDAKYEQYLAQRGAEARTWSNVMTSKFVEPKRVDLAEYYKSKGADLT